MPWATNYGSERFVSLTGTDAEGGTGGSEYPADIGVGTKIIFAEQLDVIIDYDGEFRSDFEAHQGSVAVRYYF